MLKKILFILILLLAIGLRFSFLSTVPPSASLDEATIGYNAYSILHTGRDEYGSFLPILLRAYDDYRPALYVYTVIPFVKFFGLTVLAVRLPSVILSVVTIGMAFFLVRNLFSSLKRRDGIAFLAMFLLSISPWHIYISRLGHEVNLGLTVIIASILLFLLAMQRKSPLLYVFSMLCFAISFYTYQSEKIFTPLLLLSLIVIFWKQLVTMRKYFFIGIVCFIILSTPIFFASLSPGALLRLKGTSVFTNNSQYDVSAKNILSAKNKSDVVTQLINNRRIVTGEIFIVNYFSHFNPWWLFGNSGDESFKAPNTGLLYIWELPFLLLGICFLIFSKDISKKMKLVILLWVLISFVAPGLTTQAPHAMRAYTVLPIPDILTSLGIVWGIALLSKYSKGIYLATVLLVSIVAFQSVMQFVQNYFFLFPIRQSNSFQYPIQNAMIYVKENSHSYTQVVISNKDNLYQSYMFYLFYSQYNPALYLSHGGTKSGGFNETHSIDSIQFRPINWDNERQESTLFVGNPTDFPENIGTLMQYNFLSGEKAILVVGTEK